MVHGQLPAGSHVVRRFPDSLSDPLARFPARLIPTRIRAERNLYIHQQLELLEDLDDIPCVEQLDDVEFELEEKQADNQSKTTRVRKCKYSDLSERSLMSQGEFPPENPVDRVREEFSWDSHGFKHLYGSVSDIEDAGRDAFMRHRADDIGQFLGWYAVIPPKTPGYQKVDDD